jgi:hypothetical protein
MNIFTKIPSRINKGIEKFSHSIPSPHAAQVMYIKYEIYAFFGSMFRSLCSCIFPRAYSLSFPLIHTHHSQAIHKKKMKHQAKVDMREENTKINM